MPKQLCLGNDGLKRRRVSKQVLGIFHGTEAEPSRLGKALRFTRTNKERAGGIAAPGPGLRHGGPSPLRFFMSAWEG